MSFFYLLMYLEISTLLYSSYPGNSLPLFLTISISLSLAPVALIYSVAPGYIHNFTKNLFFQLFFVIFTASLLLYISSHNPTPCEIHILSSQLIALLSNLSCSVFLLISSYRMESRAFICIFFLLWNFLPLLNFCSILINCWNCL